MRCFWWNACRGLSIYRSILERPYPSQPYTGPVQDGVNSDGYVLRHNNQPSQQAKAIFRRLALAPNLGVQDGVLSLCWTKSGRSSVRDLRRYCQQSVR